VSGLPDPRLKNKGKASTAVEEKEVVAPPESQAVKVRSPEAVGSEVVIPKTQLPPPANAAVPC